MRHLLALSALGLALLGFLGCVAYDALLRPRAPLVLDERDQEALESWAGYAREADALNREVKAGRMSAAERDRRWRALWEARRVKARGRASP